MKTVLAMFAVGLTAATALAGSRSSANYSVPADTTAAGGRRATSANYSNDGNIGGIGGISVAATKVAKHGYIGQLYDISGLSLAATPTTINEGGTRQLGASSVADDGTTVPVNASQVSWNVVSGPIISISAGGLATAGNVYQNTAATIGGRLQSYSNTLALTVLNIGIDDYGIYAGDGINDAWQVQYFGEGNPNARPLLDPDGDGQNNYFEYFADTNPTNALSKFNLSIALVLGSPTQKDIIFSPRWPIRVYDVQYRDNLTSSLWGPLTGTTTNDVATTRTVRDLNATGDTKFYRVQISFP
jgi:hypothetical protein